MTTTLNDIVTANSHAELRELTSTLRGKALQAMLVEVGMGHMRNATAARQREAVAEVRGRVLDSLAIRSLLS